MIPVSGVWLALRSGDEMAIGSVNPLRFVSRRAIGFPLGSVTETAASFNGSWASPVNAWTRMYPVAMGSLLSLFTSLCTPKKKVQGS
jgi:hypothetical protein